MNIRSLPLLAAACAALAASAQAPAPPAPVVGERAAGAVAEPIAGAAPGLFIGVGNCLGSGCHAAPRAQSGGKILGNEYTTWLRKDPHRNAYNVLLDERSRIMAGHLGIARPQEAGLCLDCHSVNAPKEKRRGTSALADGVSCEGCHGPASGWRDGHTDPSWTHDDSVAAGMVDLKLAAVRASSCLGCHLGDGTRSVDHTLIAAGHPALAFELDNYSGAMSAHWKPAAAPGAEAWAVGQAISFRDGLAQLARRASSGRWPEFADHTCTSCHHSLKAQQWKRAGAFRERERPGLPPWSPARWAVLRLVVEKAAPGELAVLDREVGELARAVERLNQPRETAAAAERAAAAMARVVPAVAKLSWDGPQVRQMLAALAANRGGWLTADVHSAEQAFFAAQSLAGFLVGGDPRLAKGDLPARLNRVYESLADPEAFDRARFSALLVEVTRAAGGP